MRTRHPRVLGTIAVRLLPAITLAAALAASGATSPAAKAYYLVVYAAQEEGHNPITSHCFATFARVAPAGGPSARPRVELHHINWFSARGHQTGVTCGLTEADGRLARPEPGENRTTREALSLAHRGGLRVSRWGPYRIDRGLFERARRQIDLLEGRVPGRKVLYKALDLGWREGLGASALNCVHAISDVDRDPAPLRTWTSYGDEAARKVVLHLGRWIKDRGREHPEAWGPIWEATWRDAPAPASLDIVQGEPPWTRRVGPGRATEATARVGAEAGEEIGPAADRSEGSAAAGGG